MAGRTAFLSDWQARKPLGKALRVASPWARNTQRSIRNGYPRFVTLVTLSKKGQGNTCYAKNNNDNIDLREMLPMLPLLP